MLRNDLPAQPQPPKGNVTLPQLSAPVVESADAAPIAVSRIVVAGSTVFPAEVLQALVADVASGNRTLGELQMAAARITAYYRQAGYFLARAILPQQKMTDGVVTIAVLEGKLEKVQIDNASRVSDATVNAYLAELMPGAVLQKAPTDRALLLLSDLPGVGGVDSRLEAGATQGETVLVTNLAAAPAWSGRLWADNYGYLYTGQNRLGASIDLNSPLGYGERFSARLIASDGSLLDGLLSAQVPVGGDGWTLGASLAHSTYQLGNAFATLDALGTADTAEAFARYPLLRSASANVYTQMGLGYRKLHDEVRSVSTQVDKWAQIATLSVQADARDGWGGGGVTQGSLGLSAGNLHIDSPIAAALDALGPKTEGGYAKWPWSLERQQAIVGNLSLRAQLRGQWTDKNLDSSEKFSLGGANGVRAYPSGEAIGDRGWLGSLDLIYAITPEVSASLFYDQGAVTVNAQPYLSTPNTLTRNGAGLGLAGNYGAFYGRFAVAWRGSEVATAEPDDHVRFWAQAGWWF